MTLRTEHPLLAVVVPLSARGCELPELSVASSFTQTRPHDCSIRHYAARVARKRGTIRLGCERNERSPASGGGARRAGAPITQSAHARWYSWQPVTDSADHARDLALLERIAHRDAAAVGDLYDRHARVLFSLICRILRDRGDAEDVLQEVLLRVWEKAESYDPILGSPIAWLVRIARNRAIDRLRARGARPAAGPDDTLPGLAVDERRVPGPERSAALAEERQSVQRALQQLPTGQRALIEAAFFDGYTHAELADRFGLPLGTVKTRIRTGMLALRDELIQFSVPQ